MLPSAYTTVGADAARFHTVSCATLYGARADAASFVYGWRCDPLLCYPPPQYGGGRFFPLLILLAGRSSTVLPSPYTTVGADGARFYTVSCAILYCATADAAIFLYGWRRDPLLCHPPAHYCRGRCCPLFKLLAGRSSTVLPRLLSGQMLPVSMRLAVRSSTVLPPPTLLLGPMLPDFILLAVRS